MMIAASPRRLAVVVFAVLLSGALVSLSPGALARNNAPLGYQLMCLKTPAECKGGGASTVKASDETLALLKRVNSSVNGAITPRGDGAADVWNASVTAGDCEDYVLAKRRALIKAGLPSSSLRIAYVETASGEGHAILVVKTSRGDFVLDNLNPSVRPLSKAGYRIISMSGANPRDWS
jgi:predicted transglutaminase-like cysteine proteinase